jgi:hypothetical protein
MMALPEFMSSRPVRRSIRSRYNGRRGHVRCESSIERRRPAQQPTLFSVLTALMGALILGERLDWRIAVALAAGFLGMLLIVGGKPGSAGSVRRR